MKAETKNNLMVWAIVILAVMNISTLVTILYHQYHTSLPGLNPILGHRSFGPNDEKFSGRFFQERLNLDSMQMKEFRQISPAFRNHARLIADELAIKRNEMFTEMNAVNCDTSRLNELSDSIGYLHASLKKLTYRYYFDMKNICNPDQQKRLEEMVGMMFPNENRMNFQGRMGRQGMHRGMMHRQ